MSRVVHLTFVMEHLQCFARKLLPKLYFCEEFTVIKHQKGREKCVALDTLNNVMFQQHQKERRIIKIPQQFLKVALNITMSSLQDGEEQILNFSRSHGGAGIPQSTYASRE